MTIQSLTLSTIKQYEICYKEWWDFCKQRNIDYCSATVRDVLQFLQNLFNIKNIKYGSFNNHRSALSLILPGQIGNDPQVCRWMKGVSKLRPPTRKYNFTWDPQQVTQMLAKWYPHNTLSLQRITRKLITLLALTTAQRMQTLNQIKVENIHISLEKIQILIPDTVKTTSIRNEQPCLQIPFFYDQPELCVASTLLAYIEKTTELRSETQNHLFLRTKKPYRAVSTQTLSRWIKLTLSEAGIDTKIFGGYSTKHSAVSTAFKNGVLLQTIRRTAGWTKKSIVFAQFYNIPVSDESLTFAKTILSQSKS